LDGHGKVWQGTHNSLHDLELVPEECGKTHDDFNHISEGGVQQAGDGGPREEGYLFDGIAA
jgi:hypothetical protein